MEMGLTLLAQSGLSPKYLVDAFLTSIYLINRLPSPVLQQESPLSKLFHHPPDYSILRAFGCLCYPLLRPYATHKLSFRSKPCIFIGYGSNEKGYRCLDPLTHKVYLSRNVIFDKTKFPAKSPSSSLGSCKVTTSLGNSLVLIPSQLHSDFNSIAAPSNRIEDMTNPIDTTSPHPSQTPLIHPPSPQPEHSVTATTFDESSTHLDTPSDSSPSLHQLPQPFLPHFSSTPHSTLPEPPPTRIVTRSQTGHSKPKHFPGFKMFHSIKHPLQVLHTIHLPP
jgi:hypothetical protein